MSRLTRYNWYALILVVLGILLIGLFASWWAALGVFLLVFGNNIELSSEELELNRLMKKGLRDVRKEG